ncbi:MAG: tRNA adenosine(34) deaminase TadA [Desulfovibrionaceae bacterium]|nr:tRNA adenosine(34) deaminase TadA [Desulfovibrionaceae bacterium]
MCFALHEAEKAEAEGEIPVGAVVVDQEGHILASEHNRSIADSNPCGHAEILALQAAGRKIGNYRLENCFLVATLEPCMMCAGALVHARICGVVYGAFDLKSGAVSSCFNGTDLPFLNHRVWHMGGVMEEECRALLSRFFAKK